MVVCPSLSTRGTASRSDTSVTSNALVAWMGPAAPGQALQLKRKTGENSSMIKPFVITLVAVVAAGVLAQAQTSPASAPTDPQIAMIVVTADNVDIAAGKLAAKKTSNPKVKEFAELMVR